MISDSSPMHFCGKHPEYCFYIQWILVRFLYDTISIPFSFRRPTLSFWGFIKSMYKAFFCIVNADFLNQFHNHLKWKQSAVTIGRRRINKEKNTLYFPESICIDDDEGCIYVADSHHHRIVQCKIGTNVWKVVAGGNGEGSRLNQLKIPSDVIFDKRSHCLIICDRGNRRVMRWALNGSQNGEVMIDGIDGISLAMDKDGDLYVFESMVNGRLNISKREVKKWKRGEKEGVIVINGDQLCGARFICIDDNYSIYASGLYTHCVLKWEKGAKEGVIVAGGPIFSIKVDYTLGICVNHLGDLYVGDNSGRKITCWSSGSKDGRIVVGRDGKGYQPNRLNMPIKIAFDRQNNLYVVDSFNNRIQRFDIDNS